jgi:hypothetical protein
MRLEEEVNTITIIKRIITINNIKIRIINNRIKNKEISTIRREITIIKVIIITKRVRVLIRAQKVLGIISIIKEVVKISKDNNKYLTMIRIMMMGENLWLGMSLQ